MAGDHGSIHEELYTELLILSKHLSHMGFGRVSSPIIACLTQLGNCFASPLRINQLLPTYMCNIIYISKDSVLASTI